MRVENKTSRVQQISNKQKVQEEIEARYSSQVFIFMYIDVSIIRTIQLDGMRVIILS